MIAGASAQGQRIGLLADLAQAVQSTVMFVLRAPEECQSLTLIYAAPGSLDLAPTLRRTKQCSTAAPMR
jgi:hypothetical protein